MKELRYRAQVFKNPADLVSAAARQWFEAVKVLKDNQAFNVALSGGRIAVPFLQEASALFGKSPALLKRLNVFWADERCVGPEHPESNYAMFRENFANPVSFPDSRVFRFRGEDHPDKAAKSMASTLKVKLPLNSRGVPAFDLIFLGMGEDGHVASLFPENMSDDLMRSDDHVFEVVASKPPPQRLTLSYNVLETSKHVCALICGPGKESALRESIGNHGKTPFAHVIQSRVHTEILTDISINDHV